MINGVLTERTVKDVLPTLQTNAEGLKKVLEDLVKQYQNKQSEMEKWKVCLPLGISLMIVGTDYEDRKRTTSKSCSNDLGSRDWPLRLLHLHRRTATPFGPREC